ncbi:uncharacterized protein [Porites lutea]|uniref:uncharacterized protein n=1 Tax=Porites lutea TaxID=51062 RepID=UPI003CC5B767
MFIDQFGYWAPCITAVYHVGFKEKIIPKSVSGYRTWSIVNFRFIPVAHQLNFCLAVSLVWATILSIIRASEASHVKEIESIDTISITNYSVEATQQWPWSDGPWRKKGKQIRCANFRGCHQLCHSNCLAAGSLRMRLAMLQFMVSPYEAGWAEAFLRK